MFYKFFNSQTRSITFAAAILTLSGIFSMVLALVRDRLLAGRFGAGAELDIYFAAFRIPDFVYGILIMGGISTVFLPVFSQYFKKDPEEGWRLTNNVLNCFLLILIVICTLLCILTPFFVRFIVPGFDIQNRALVIALTRIMFLSPILLGISSVFSGVLHYFSRFLVYSLCPILYNLGIIFGIVFLYPAFGINGLAYGVILGALMHWVIQIPAARYTGYKYRLSLNFKYPGLVKLFKLMVPRTIGSAAYHINLIVITAIASTLQVGSIAVFNFAYNINYIPVGLVGIPFALAVFPAMSRNFVHNEKERFLKNFSSTFRQILFLVTPMSVFMFLLRAQIIRLILGTGRFGWEDTRLTAACLGLFCFGIFAAALSPFLCRTFYSFHDTKTPVILGVICISFNVGLSFLFVRLLSFENVFRNMIASLLKMHDIENLQVLGLPLALSVFAVVYLSLLLIFLRKRINDLDFGKILVSFKKILLATFTSSFTVYFVLKITAPLVDMHTFFGVLIQASFALIAGSAVYLLFTFLLRSPELRAIKNSFFKKSVLKNQQMNCGKEIH